VYKNLTSLLITHTGSESTIFVDGHVRTDQEFEAFVTSLFPQIAQKHNIPQALIQFYPSTSEVNSPYANVTQRLRDFLRDTSFTCNIRSLAKAFEGKARTMVYETYPAWHALDLMALFVSPNNVPRGTSLAKLFKQPYLDVFEKYRGYISRYITTNDPNELSSPVLQQPLSSGFRAENTAQGPYWPTTNTTEAGLDGALHISEQGVRIGEDKLVPRLNCEYVSMLEQKGTMVAGYSPPGSPRPMFDQIFAHGARVRAESVEPMSSEVGELVDIREIIRFVVEANGNQTQVDKMNRWSENV
jgi:hypothetical protein